jgi:hypothetical protein
VPLRNGEAKWSDKVGPVAAVRVRLTADATNMIAIREITLEDEVLTKVTVVIPGQSSLGKLSVKCDFSKVPANLAVRMRDQLDDVSNVYFTCYPDIVKLIDAPEKGLAHDLEVRFKNDMKAGVPGYASGSSMTFNINFLLHVPQEVRGMFIHELTHVAQGYSGKGNRPGWLVEGLAEAVRYQLSPPDDAWRIAVDNMNPANIDYHNAYRDTARFLWWVDAQKNPGLIGKLNLAMKENRYGEKTWTDLTGKNPDEWLKAFRDAKGK